MYLLICRCFRHLICLIILQSVLLSNNVEPWISTDDLNKIKINMSLEEVINILGDPVFIESINDDDEIIIKLIYSFRIKTYDKDALEQSDSNITNLSPSWGKMTKIQFLFTDNYLTSWEEDKLTLSMAANNNSKGSSLTAINIFLNIIVITLNAAVLMSL